jgi:hypothetical protein
MGPPGLRAHFLRAHFPVSAGTLHRAIAVVNRAMCGLPLLAYVAQQTSTARRFVDGIGRGI